MPITYTVDRSRKLITETWTGDVHNDDLAAHWRRYLKDRDVMKIRRTLVDIRHAVIHFDAHQLTTLIDDIVFPVVYGKKWKWKTAIVVGNTDQFKVGQQYQGLAQYFSDDAIFDTVEQARQWLGRPGSAES